MSSHIVTCAACGRKNRVPAAASGVPHCGHCHATLPWIADADDTSFAEVAEKSVIPALVDLWAPWCGPCRQVSPALEQVAAELAGQVKLVKVNVDDSPRISSRFDVTAVPTLLVMRNGEVISRQAGAAPAHVLRQWVTGVLADYSARRDR
ncbi:thioredoxin [Nonomuraea mangrovi]|uniref:Thioredoxin n=1 Tax=Nonomuraea mangrovi TaxID=2316207 RepID=A0ABW4TBF9_9ACTN